MAKIGDKVGKLATFQDTNLKIDQNKKKFQNLLIRD